MLDDCRTLAHGVYVVGFNRKDLFMATATTTAVPRRKYEAVIIMHPDTPEEEQKNLFKKNRDILKNFKGEVNHLDTWGKRRLANPIEKLTRGIFFHTTFESEGEAIAELERTMRINDRVLRYVHTRLDDRVQLSKFVEEFKNALAESINREKERESKMQAKRVAMQARRKERFDREDEDEQEG